MNKNQFIIAATLLFQILLLTACASEEDFPESAGLCFRAGVREVSRVETRGEITVNTVTHSDYNTPFYVEMINGGSSSYGVYGVRSGDEGRLSFNGDGDDLNWKDATSDHTFYSWTFPWTQDTYIPGGSTRTTISFNQQAEMYSSLDPKQNVNCAILEKFIGTTAGPVNYKENGEYVELRFQHLVSRIKIGTLTIIKSNGQTDHQVRGNITFLGMPETATFDRHPRSGGAPVVTANNGEGDPKDVTYDLGQTSVFYVCPGVDFSKLQFRVDINTDYEYSKEGAFFGDFSQVVFNREEYPGWDDGKSPTILYAGEEMVLNLTLTQGHGVGVTLTIQGWNQDATGTGKSYSHKGIYSDGEAQDVSNFFSGNYEDMPEKLEEILDMFGDDGVFHLYDDVDLNQVNFSMGKDYVLDGMGHTVKLKPTSQNPNKVRIGNCRDIYITDGEYTVYIDADGYIFRIDENGEKIPTDQKLPEFKDGQNSYSIDLKTGVATAQNQK